MNLQEAMAALEAAGSEQTRKTYTRFGVSPNQFGVSYATLGALVKKIKVDHALAKALWDTGNHDARILATMIADPKQTTEEELEAWAGDLDNRVLTEGLSSFAAKTPHAQKKAEEWGAADNEWRANAGWNMVTHLAGKSGDKLPDDWYRDRLGVIEREIHSRPNWVRYAMNHALIAIGIRGGALKDKAVAAAGRIGKVEVDHGDTSCKTPDAVPYIEKALARKKG